MIETPGPIAKTDDRLQSIQALRAVAALMVVVYHATTLAVDRAGLTTAYVWKSGEAGVDIFFAISGLVMGLTYFRSGRRDWSDFLRRRLLRIVPMYWLATSLKLFSMLAIPALAVHSHFDAWHTLASYLFIPAKNLDGTVYPLLWVGWTLNFEMLFYYLFSLGLALRVSLLKFLTLTLVACACLGVFRTSAWPAPLHLLDPILLEFLGGIWLAAAVTKGLTLGRTSSALLVLFAFLIILVAPATTDQSLARALFWGVPALAIVTVFAVSRWQPPRWVLELGNASYAIYLFHGFVMTATGFVIKRFGLSGPVLLLTLVGSVIGSALIGALMYKVLEAPVLRALNRRFLKPRARVRLEPAPSSGSPK